LIYCFDTSIVIYALNRSNDRLAKSLRSTKPNWIKVPEMVHAELLYGVSKSARKAAVSRAVQAFLEPYELLPFAVDAVEHYAGIRGQLDKKGKVIEPADLVIAATSRAAGAVLITHNSKEFARVPGLQIEDWTK
jgi:tRNA(fMet)-specific endonuclease VapC